MLKSGAIKLMHTQKKKDYGEQPGKPKYDVRVVVKPNSLHWSTRSDPVLRLPDNQSAAMRVGAFLPQEITFSEGYYTKKVN